MSETNEKNEKNEEEERGRSCHSSLATRAPLDAAHRNARSSEKQHDIMAPRRKYTCLLCDTEKANCSRFEQSVRGKKLADALELNPKARFYAVVRARVEHLGPAYTIAADDRVCRTCSKHHVKRPFPEGGERQRRAPKRQLTRFVEFFTFGRIKRVCQRAGDAVVALSPWTSRNAYASTAGTENETDNETENGIAEEARIADDGEQREGETDDARGDEQDGKHPNEPGEDEAGVSKLVIRLPEGSRAERRFYSSDRISDVYNFVDTLDELDVDRYSLVSNFPRKTFTKGGEDLTLVEAGVHPNGALFVQIEES